MFGKRLVTRIAAGVTMPVMLYVVIITDSRLGMVGFLLSFMLYLLLWMVIPRAASVSRS